MAATLRHPLGWLALAAMTAVYLPLLPAAGLMLAPAFSLAGWQALFADPQFSQALAATLVSTTLAAVGALALCVAMALWPGAGWRRLSARLPWLLAVPHVAFATAALLLFAEGGAFYRLCTVCTPQLDRYGIGLGVTLAVKESGFILWALYALLPEEKLAPRWVVMRTLGYSRVQGFCWLALPEIAPALGALMLAVIAWSLSVVDVAIVLGPGNPPTLAVLAWQWLSQGDPAAQTKGALICLLLMGLLAGYAAFGGLLWQLWRRRIPSTTGRRGRRVVPSPGRPLGWLVPLSGIACAGVLAVLAVLARDFTLTSQAFYTSLTFGVTASLLALALILLWLEWGPQRRGQWLWLPLVLPALPLVAGQYQLALWFQVDGDALTVIWGHLLWVIPWMLLLLQPAWRAIDPRKIVVARTLGLGRAAIFWRLKCPMLIRPLLTALATGFSVSMAQYMPTLWLGAGRYPTLTTEAVALSSGGSVPLLAARALWLLALTAAFFGLAAGLSRLAGRYRQGLR